MSNRCMKLCSVDPEIASAIENEVNRQRNKIELIASENFVSQAVLEALGSPLTNKYAEGYPGRRYYGGCEYVDIVENLAIQRAKLLFGADHANVQPHSGAQANMAAFFALLNPGDTILGMNLSHGGHLTHGMSKNISGKYYNAVFYGVDKSDCRINYDEVRKIAKESKPKLIIAGASAYPREIDFSIFREIADEVGAYLLADMAHIAGLVAVGIHSSPIPYAHIVTSTTHKTLRGPRGGLILCKQEMAKNIDSAVFPGTQGGPLMHVIAAKAVSFKEALSDEFREYQKQIVKNAKVLGEALINKGFKLVSGGTDNHMILVDLTNKNITGNKAQSILDEAGITVNKNSIPFDTQSTSVTSGIRIGTPAVTTRGMREDQMEEIADLINLTIDDFNSNRERIIKRVKTLCDKFPLYMQE